MSDDWYGIAQLDHFWIRRRFEVLHRLVGDSLGRATEIADVGCGHGVLQRQIEDAIHREVTGFDLNELALRRSVSRISPLCCYDLFQRDREYESRFDLVFLFDVLEHLRDDRAFLNALQFHLAPTGRIVINVPAFQFLWSKYDQEAGHCRRYNAETLSRVAQDCGMAVRRWTYWGLTLTPLLIARKLWLAGRSDDQIISAGFDSRGATMNRMLLALARCELIPQHLLGSSLMVVLGRT